MRVMVEKSTLDKIDLDLIKSILHDEVIDSITDLEQFSEGHVISLMREGIVWNIKRIQNVRKVYRKMFNQEIELTDKQQKIFDTAVVKIK